VTVCDHHRSSQNERSRVSCAWFTAGLGLLASVLSVSLWVEHQRFVANSLRTEGVVTRVDPPSDPVRGESVVQYHVDGVAFEIIYEWASERDDAASRVNRTVTVLYQQKHPEAGRVEGSSARGSIVVTFSIVAAVAFTISALGFLAPMLSRRGSGPVPAQADRELEVLQYARRKDPRAARRIVLGSGLGFFFASVPCAALLIFWDRSSPLPFAIVLAVVVSFAVASPLFLFSAFSSALFYRCPQCRKRLKRLIRDPLPDGTGQSMRYSCDRCRIQWEIGWQERSGDD
jgi:hypothetical protein